MRTETPISPTGIIHLCINLFDLAPPVTSRPGREAYLLQLGLVVEVVLVPHDECHEIGLALPPAVVRPELLLEVTAKLVRVYGGRFLEAFRDALMVWLK